MQIPMRSIGTYDLHVLGTPPAFILSQDQTLQKKGIRDNLRFSLIPEIRQSRISYLFPFREKTQEFKSEIRLELANNDFFKGSLFKGLWNQSY
ncbi:MAG: hypothetical protein HYW51_00280 [Candidatus Doudnabacteria bacterium]|nr:hypothetical protein [Candidatus Doudnabacteria bacterium]